MVFVLLYWYDFLFFQKPELFFKTNNYPLACRRLFDLIVLLDFLEDSIHGRYTIHVIIVIRPGRYPSQLPRINTVLYHPEILG